MSDPLIDLAAAALGADDACPAPHILRDAIAAELASLDAAQRDEAERRRQAVIASADNQVDAARTLARGMCEAQGCRCSLVGRADRWCVAWALYGDLALAGVMAAEADGWLLARLPAVPVVILAPEDEPLGAP